ncbi:hypothetical protein F5B19DRAFT_468312 [Rostrohypoxylon terebratum]|nr:hypothetical protein F5B19DRAFT_468312 [Rostrohypoxylon terebratum]
MSGGIFASMRASALAWLDLAWRASPKPLLLPNNDQRRCSRLTVLATWKSELAWIRDVLVTCFTGNTDKSQALVYLSVGFGSILVDGIQIHSLATSLSP